MSQKLTAADIWLIAVYSYIANKHVGLHMYKTYLCSITRFLFIIHVCDIFTKYVKNKALTNF